MKRILLSTLGVCAAIVLAGCGGGSGSSCGVADTCGGDVVGIWTITDACTSTKASDLSPNCPTGSIFVMDLHTSGTFDYRADMTYSWQATVSLTERMTLPRECLGTTTCAALSASFQADPHFSSASCVASGTGCVCVLASASVSGTETGAYTTSAGVVTLTPTTRAPEQDNYCIKGSTMTVASTVGMMGVMGMQAAGTLTLVKQP
jgi:hypothetical protein